MIQRISLIFLISLAINQDVFCQQNKVDSLKNELTHASDTTRINILIELANTLIDYGDPEAEIYANEAFALSDSLKYDKGLAISKWHLANITYQKENYLKAAELFNECIELFANLDSIKWMISYHAIGNCFLQMSLFDRALEYHLEGLEKSELLGKPQYIARSLRNVGTAYKYIGEIDKSLEYFLKALKLVENSEPGFELARILTVIGNVYTNKHEYDLANEYYKRSLVISRTIGSKWDEVQALLMTGAVYRYKELPDSAMPYLEQCLELCHEMDYSKGSAGSYSELSLVYQQLENIKKAKEYGLLAYEYAKNLDYLNHHSILKDLHDILEASGDYKTALKFRKIHMAIKDSLNKEQNNREIGKIEAKYEFDKQRKEEERQRMEEESIAAQKRQRNLVLLFSGIGFLLLIVIFGIIYLRTLGRKNRQITQQKEKIEAFSQVQSNFFSNISHEFRTPLTLILSPLRILESTARSKEDLEEMEIIRKSANKLLQLVNQILDLSKLESGQMDKKLSVGNLTQHMLAIYASFDSLSELRSIEYQKQFPDADIITEFNPDHIDKILSNVLSNAFKFTNDGGKISMVSELIVQRGKSSSNKRNTLLQITVKDTGVGIPPDKLGHVFDRLFQVDDSAKLNYEGTGIGLAMVKELVEYYDGKVEIESEIGWGTQVTIRLPLDNLYSKDEIADQVEQITDPTIVEALDAEIESDQKPFKKSHAVLIVEDSVDLRNHLHHLLNEDYDVLLAENGEAGLELALDQMPDVIVSDVMMPRMSGIEMTEKLKNDVRTSHIPIILLTAKADKQDKLKGLKIGADDYLTKPFDAEELKVRIENVIKTREDLQKKIAANILVKPSSVDIPSVDEQFLKKAISIVEKHIDDETFSVDVLSKEIGMSRAHFHRKIKALINLPTTHFIRAIRLERAKELLEKGTGNIAEVAYSVGFSSRNYFTRCFQDHFGKTPSEIERKI